MGHAAGAPDRAVGGLQGRPPADAGPPARAVPALQADRRGLRVPEPRVRRLGGRRRDRDAREPRRRGRHQDDRRLDRPGRLPARLGERLPDDDAARGCGRARVHARAGRSPLRGQAGPGPRLHRLEGRRLGQHSRRPRHRRQDRRPADRAVRLGRERPRAPGRALTRAPQVAPGARPAGARLEGARHDAARPAARLRSLAAGALPARPLAAEGDVPPVRVQEPAAAGRRDRRGASGGTHAGRGSPGSVAGGPDRRARGRGRDRGRGRPRRSRRRATRSSSVRGRRSFGRNSARPRSLRTTPSPSGWTSSTTRSSWPI